MIERSARAITAVVSVSLLLAATGSVVVVGGELAVLDKSGAVRYWLRRSGDGDGGIAAGADRSQVAGESSAGALRGLTVTR